jgi:hypothetical protein
MLNCFRSTKGLSGSDGLRRGTSGPRNYVVERGEADETLPKNGNPWRTLSNLIRISSEHSKKLPRLFRHKGPRIADLIENTAPAPLVLGGRNANMLTGVGDGHSARFEWNKLGCEEGKRDDSLSRASTGFDNSTHTITEESDCALRQSVITEPTRGAAGPVLEAAYDPDQIIRLSVDSSRDGTSKDGKQYATRTPDPSSAGFCTSAISMRDHMGNFFGSETVLYDTGSPDNIVTQKIIERYEIPVRPLFGKDVRVYETLGGTIFAATHYMEIEIKDDGNNIREFEKVYFYVVKSMGEWDCILGRKFMNAHNFNLTASSGPRCAVLVLTKKKASKGRIIWNFGWMSANKIP